jgi:hypothetical protein
LVLYIKEKLYLKCNRYKELYTWIEKIIIDVLFSSLWHLVDVGSAADVSEVHAAFISTGRGEYIQVLVQQTRGGIGLGLKRAIFYIFLSAVPIGLNQALAFLQWFCRTKIYVHMNTRELGQ